MKLEFGYGNDTQIVDIPRKNLMSVLEAYPIAHKYKGVDAVRHAMDKPIGTDRLLKLVKPGQKIAIIASDISRPVPSYEILPSVLEELFAAGCQAQDITVVFALGSHRCHTEEEKRRLPGYIGQSQSHNSSHLLLPNLVTKRSFSMSMSLFLLCK